MLRFSLLLVVIVMVTSKVQGSEDNVINLYQCNNGKYVGE